MKLKKDRKENEEEKVNLTEEGEDFSKSEQEGSPSSDEAVIRESKRQSRIAIASFIFTIFSMIYAIGQGIILILNNWIMEPYSYILMAVLVVYAVAFFVVVFIYVSKKDIKRGSKRVKILKKIFSIFRSFTTLVFLIVTIVSMIGIIDGDGSGAGQVMIIIIQIIVTFIWLSLKIAILVIRSLLKRRGKEYSVKVSTYINGISKDNRFATLIHAKMYGTKKIESEQEETVPALTPATNETVGEVGTVKAEKEMPEQKTASSGLPVIERIKISSEKAKEHVAKAVAKASKTISSKNQNTSLDEEE